MAPSGWRRRPARASCRSRPVATAPRSRQASPPRGAHTCSWAMPTSRTTSTRSIRSLNGSGPVTTSSWGTVSRAAWRRARCRSFIAGSATRCSRSWDGSSTAVTSAIFTVGSVRSGAMRSCASICAPPEWSTRPRWSRRAPSTVCGSLRCRPRSPRISGTARRTCAPGATAGVTCASCCCTHPVGYSCIRGPCSCSSAHSSRCGCCPARSRAGM